MSTSETTATYNLRIPAAAGGDIFEIDDYVHTVNAIEDLLDGTTTGKTFSFGGAIARDDDTVVAIGRAFTPTAGDDGYHLRVGGTITEASSGTHGVVAGIRIDAFALTNAAGATTDLAALYLAGAPTGASPTNGPYTILAAGGRSRFAGAVAIDDAVDIEIGTGLDAVIRWSTGDSSNHALSIGLGDSNQGLHITDKGAIATDWNIAATTHPNVYVHSNTTPATDYLRLGDHDGTTAYIDLVGGTNLDFQIDGTSEMELTATILAPSTSDGLALGSTSLMWGDLFLASAGVINFNNGDVTLTHGSNVLTLDGGVLSVDDTTDSTSGTSGSIHTDGGLGVAKNLVVTAQADIEGYMSVGNGAALSASRTLRVNRSYSVSSGNADQMGVGGTITMTGGSGDVHAGILVEPGGVVINSGSGHNVYTMRLVEPNLTMTSGTAHLAATLMISSAATEATSNYALFVDSGICRLDEGTIIGATTSQDNLLDDSTHSGSSATLYIGNQSITTSSDMRVKTNIVDANVNALDILRPMTLKRFNWDDPTDIGPVNQNSRGDYYGFVAQETIQHTPWIINAEDRECAVCLAGKTCADHPQTWKVEYQHLVPLLIQAIKELEAEITILKGDA